MALLFMDGFDAGDFRLKWDQISSAGSLTTTTNTRFSAGRAFDAPNNIAGQALLKKLFTPSSKTIMGMAFKTTVGNDSSSCIFLYGDSGVTNHLSIRLMTSGRIGLYRGASQLAISSASLWLVDNWHYIEASAIISDTVGACEIKLDGTSIINFTGDTKNGGTNTTLDAVEYWYYASSCNVKFDDVYILDGTGPAPLNDFLGDVKIQTIVPTGAGSQTQLAPTGSANNWDTVNELPYSTTDYNSSSTPGQQDSYALSDLLANTASVHGIQTNIVAHKSDAGTGNIRSTVRSGGTTFTDPTATLSTGPKTFSAIRATDPATATDWTVSGVNNLEAGVEII